MTSMRARLNSKGHLISDCSIHQPNLSSVAKTFLLSVNQTVAMDTNLKGRDSYASKRGTHSSEQMVLSLLESYENNGHVVYMKIFYSSPNLYLQLQKKVLCYCLGN